MRIGIGSTAAATALAMIVALASPRANAQTCGATPGNGIHCSDYADDCCAIGICSWWTAACGSDLCGDPYCCSPVGTFYSYNDGDYTNQCCSDKSLLINDGGLAIECIGLPTGSTCYNDNMCDGYCYQPDGPSYPGECEEAPLGHKCFNDGLLPYDECDAGHCAGGYCVPTTCGGVGVPCSANTDCCSPDTCDLTTNLCIGSCQETVGGTCDEPGYPDCCGDRVCVDNVCVVCVSKGGSCTSGSQCCRNDLACTSGVCTQDTNTSPCASSSNCPNPNWNCVPDPGYEGSICEPLPPGAPCVHPDDCVTDMCSPTTHDCCASTGTYCYENDDCCSGLCTDFMCQV
jgi:hypothetical protein